LTSGGELDVLGFGRMQRAGSNKAGLDRAIANGWLMLHVSGTFVRFTQASADLFA
jgi:hypothetical protein